MHVPENLFLLADFVKKKKKKKNNKNLISPFSYTANSRPQMISWSPVNWNHRISYLYHVVSDKFFSMHNSCYVL